MVPQPSTRLDEQKHTTRPPFELAIGLAASGAAMYVGVTTNEVSAKDIAAHRGGLIALWWRGPVAPKDSAVAEAVFFDICELASLIPDCALGRVMEKSTPAASASGGQAASSSGLASGPPVDWTWAESMPPIVGAPGAVFPAAPEQEEAMMRDAMEHPSTSSSSWSDGPSSDDGAMRLA